MSTALKRLQKDYLEYYQNRDEFSLISAEPLEENLFEWHVNICASDGPYANRPLHLILTFPENYPLSPPKVLLCTRINHPNVFRNYGEDGAWICLDILKEYTANRKYEGWSSVYSLTSILLQLQSFLFSENVPQDYGGNSNLAMSNSDVCSSLKRIENFHCKKCGHCYQDPKPELPEAYCKLVKPAEGLLAQKGAVVYGKSLMWREFPEWKIGAWDCGDLLKNKGGRYQYECKIDWGWSGFYREDIRIGWGVITSRNPLKYKVIAENRADVSDWFWPEKMKVGDRLSTAIDLERKQVWYAHNGKVIANGKRLHFDVETLPADSEDLVPIFRFRACRILLNFEKFSCVVQRFQDSGFQVLELPKNLPTTEESALQEWKNDCSADVFPPDVFQVILEFLCIGDIIKARGSCESVRSLIEEIAIIPRREVHCFVTKNSWKECTLGMGLTAEKSRKGNMKEMKPNMEFLSLECWESGKRNSAWGMPLTDYLVLPISRQHANPDLMVKFLGKLGAKYGQGDASTPRSILNILSTLMNMCVVSMMREIKAGKMNEKLLVGYTQFHHLLLAMNEHFPGISELAEKNVQSFIQKPSYRHKKQTPDLGKLLVMATLCTDLDFDNFMHVFFQEVNVRRVLWYLKECGALANPNGLDEVYCQRVFELTEVSRNIVAFQVAFMKILALPKSGETLSDLLSKYYLRYGQPRAQDVEALFTRAKEIIECKTWREHLSHLDLYPTGDVLARMLKDSVGLSLSKGYHTHESHHGRGRLKAERGNPACEGLFGRSMISADDCEFIAEFWIPRNFMKEVRNMIKNFDRAYVKIPKSSGKPVKIGTITISDMQQLKQAILNSFPYISFQPLQNAIFELSYEDCEKIGAKRRIEFSRQCCVATKLPKPFGLPILRVAGSAKGIQQFRYLLELSLQKNIIDKREQTEEQVCSRCAMAFPSSKGAMFREKFVCRFCWTHCRDLLRADWKKQEDEKRRARDAERRMKQEKERQARLEAKLAELKKKQETTAADLKNKNEKIQSSGLPATFITLRRALVRAGAEMTSKEVGEIENKTVVEVHEISGNRARIVLPFAGWVSIITKKGVLIDLRTQNVAAFPALGATHIPEIAKVKYSEKKVIPAPKESKPAKKSKPTKKNKTFRKPVRTFRTPVNTQKRRQSIGSASSDSGSTSTTMKIAPQVDADGFTSVVYKKNRKMKKISKGWYKTVRAAVVRQTMSKQSRFICDLKSDESVYVAFVDENAKRARITQPTRGWISILTAKGKMLR